MTGPINDESRLAALCLDLDQHPDAWALQKMLQDGNSIVVETQLLRDVLERLQAEQNAVLAKDLKTHGASGDAPNYDLNLQLCGRLKAVLGE